MPSPVVWRMLSLAAVAALVTPTTGAERRPWPLRVVPSEAPARANSGQPQFSGTDGGPITLSWIEQDGPRSTLKFADRNAGEWSKPRTVASGDDWFVNWADVPSVVRLRDGTLVAHWLQKSASSTYAYDVRLAYSTNGGRAWSPSFSPHHDGTPTEHGFASLFEMPRGGLGLVWLDGRAMVAESEGASHPEGTAGAMSVRFASYDSHWKQSEEVVVDDRVCECCPTTAAVTADGVVVAFRNRTHEEVRDIHVARSDGHTWSASRPVHADGWRIPACPVNGPALAARERVVAVAWFSARDDEGHAYVAFSEDAGRSFGAPVRLDDASALGRVDIVLLEDGSAAASWMEFGDGRAAFEVRRIERSGRRSEAVTVASVDGRRASGYPRLARHHDELLFAWTESANGRSRVVTAAARLPAAER